MTKIFIKKISLTNFKGQTRSVEFTSKDIRIKGRNEAGKTTLLKAWNWLLSGYTDAHNGANHELFDNKEEVCPETPLAVVEAVVTIGEYDFILKKTAEAKFTKPRGSEEYEKAKSDVYKTYIDDIEYTATNFKEWIKNNICDPEMLIYCLDGHFFANLSIDDKEKAIKLIQSIVGEINKEDLKGDYEVLFKMMERYSVSDLKAQTKSRIKPINERIKTLPDIINSKESEVAKLRSIDFAGILSQAESKKAKIADIDSELSGISSSIEPLLNSRNAELEKISNLESNIRKRESEYNLNQGTKLNGLKSKLSEINSQNKEKISKFEDAKRSIEQLKREIESDKALLISKKAYLQSLRDKRAEVKSQLFSIVKCSYCGSELPLERQAELQDSFNEQKALQLESIVKEGKALSEYCAKLESGISEKESNLIIPEQAGLVDTSELESEIEKEMKAQIPFNNTEEYLALSKQLDDLKANIPSIPKMDTQALMATKKLLMEEFEHLNRELGQKDSLVRAEKELESLKTEQRDQGIELAKLQRLENQIKSYEREKAQIASLRVNELLDYCMIETQELQKDGGYKDSCTIRTRNGIKYTTVNGGSRILIAVDLQRMFCRYFNVGLPIWIDECLILDDKRVPTYEDAQVFSIIREECDLTIEYK